MKKTTRNLLLLSLAACFLILTVKMTIGALPNQLKAARMTDATLASTIDDEVGDLETAVADILGISIDVNMSASMFATSSSGLTEVRFQAISDPASPTTGAMWLSSTTANVIKYYSGTKLTLATLTNTLADFAATTSSQLAGVISDETGSGSLVFSTAPQISTIELGHATDSTLTRPAAGRVQVEGVELVQGVGLKKIDIIRKTAETQVVNNSTTLVNDDILLAALAANEVIYFTAHIYQTGPDTADFKAGFTAPSGATIIWVPVSGAAINTSATIGPVNPVTSSGGSFSAGSDSTASRFSIDLIGSVRNGANAGNLQFQWAQASAVATDTTVRIDSYLVVYRQ